jgi:hypothetical protein
MRQTLRLLPDGVVTLVPTPSYSGPPETSSTWQNW